MKARDIEKRLEDKLPLLTDRFTRQVVISSITPSGTVATATTASIHNLSVGNSVIIAGADAPIGITSLDRSSEIATIVTTTDHDLTERFFPSVLLSGFNESEFNGEFTLLRVPNRKTFTIAVADSGPASGTGSGILEEPGSPFGYNGRVKVTAVPSTVTFTYDLPVTLTEQATGDNLRAILGGRIYSAISIERADEIFEAKDLNGLAEGDLAAFVILGNVVASRDRNSLNDAVSSGGVTGDNRQQILMNATIVVKQKVTTQTSAANALDNMQDIGRHLINTLVGWSPGTGFAVESGNKLRFLNHGLLDYNTVIYSHIFEFELLSDISNEDLNIQPFNVAFRDISFSFVNDKGIQELTANVNLDDEPLG